MLGIGDEISTFFAGVIGGQYCTFWFIRALEFLEDL